MGDERPDVHQVASQSLQAEPAAEVVSASYLKAFEASLPVFKRVLLQYSVQDTLAECQGLPE